MGKASLTEIIAALVLVLGVVSVECFTDITLLYSVSVLWSGRMTSERR